MHKVVSRVALLVLLIASLGASASAGTISSMKIRYSSGPTDSMSYRVGGIVLKDFDPWQEAGKTLWFASDADSPGFSSAVMALTDGQSDLIYLFSYDNNNGSGYMSYQFPGVDGTGEQDFTGYQINRIGLEVVGWNSLYDSLDFYEMVDYSAVPEPSSLIALGALVAPLLAVRKRRP